jgi:spermidine/putrescine transport system substrate-binding protein
MSKLLKKIYIRSIIVLFWVAISLFFLQLPHIVSLFSSKKTLYIATWPLLIDARYIQKFEKDTGIKVEMTYFERSEELYSKLKATGGRGYDIIFPSDYTVNLLIKEGLLKKIDRSKLDFWHRLDTRLLGNYYDPLNEYSIPFFWGVFGLGFNKKIYGEHPDPSWQLLFSPESKHIVMSDNPRESVLISAQYLFGNVQALKDVQARDAVKKLLKEQKIRVDVYTDERVDDLLSTENNQLALGLATDISRATRRNRNIGFLVPKEGSFFIIDSVAIPKNSTQELAYMFINYLYRQEVMNHHIQMYQMCSPLLDTIKSDICDLDAQQFERLNFLTDAISEKEFNEIWIDVLAY